MSDQPNQVEITMENLHGVGFRLTDKGQRMAVLMRTEGLTLDQAQQKVEAAE